ncbi:MAG: Gfo/Idh/MocA family oxidoreductase [Candidatus Latescibacteria bacterium]|nr:Gfo/Idh/MocA family oxidoreductase [Candidatus Latescibacterota bacterium]
MIRLGLVGGAGAYHGRAFSALINGLAEGQARPEGWPAFTPQVEGARIVSVWDPDRGTAEALAQVFGIARVADRMEDAADGADGVIVTDDMTKRHHHRAKPFLRAGVPTFIDKPLASDVEEAAELVDLAVKHGTPMMSASSLRYAKETEDLRANPGALGNILAATAVCRGELIYYGIHPLELAVSILGTGVRSVQNVGREGQNVVQIDYRDGRSLVLIVYAGISSPFQLNLYGDKGWRQVVVTDSAAFYSNLLGKVAEMCHSKRPPIPYAETLEIIRILVAAQRSLYEERKVVIG